MKSKRKLLLWLAIAVAALCAVVVVAAIVAPRLIDSEAVRSKITTIVAGQVGGTLAYDRLELDLIPLPRVRLHGLDVAIPGTGRLRAAALEATPRILPLLTGDLQLSRVKLATPLIDIERPTHGKDGQKENEPLQAGSLRADTSAFFSDLGENAPDMTIVVQNGRFNLLENGTPLLQVEDINGRLVTPPEGLSIDITCRASAWEQVAMKAKLNTMTLAGNGQVTLQGVNYEKLAPLFSPAKEIPVTASVINIDGTFAYSDTGRFSARWTASLPVLSIRHTGETIELPVTHLDGDVQMTADDLQLTLSEVEIGEPGLNLSGRLLKSNTSPRIAIEAKIPKDDLKTVREATLELFGDIPIVKTITDVVHLGTATDTIVRLQGDSWADLGVLNNFYLQGSITGGHIVVPGLELDLKNANGDVIIADGILTCNNVDAAMGSSTLSGGTLTLGLAGGDAPFHLEADIRANLKELPAVLEKAVTDKAVLEQVRAITRIDGQAQGKLVLGESLGNVNVAVTVNSIKAEMTHSAIPHPLKLTGGRVSFKDKRIEAGGLSGSVGRSVFEKLSGQLTLASPFPSRLTTANLKFDLKENLAWINQVEAIRGAFSDIRSLSGTAHLVDATLSGPLTAPLERIIRAKGKMADVVYDSKLLPYPVTVVNANFELAAKQGHTTFTYADADVKLQDAAFHLSGSLARDLTGISRSETTLSGHMGPDSVKTLSRQLHLPQDYQIGSPIEVSGARILWEKEAFTVSGNLQIAGAPTVTLDLHQAPGDLNLRVRLTSFGERIAESTLAISGKSAELAFKGEVDDATIAKLVAMEGLPAGQLRGDFKARIVMDQPNRSTAEGRLEIKNIVFPWNLPVPVRIHGAVLTGKGDRLIIENAEVICQEQQMALKGEIGFGDKGVQLNMDLTGDGFDLTPVVNAYAKEPGKEQAEGAAGVSQKNRKPDKKAAAAEELPISGTIRVDLGRLTYDRFVWKPFRADVALKPGRADVTVKETALCSLAMPGKLTFTPHDVAVDFTVSAENQEVRPTHQCLLGPDFQATGTFDLEGVFKGRSKIEDLPKSIEGRVKYVARDGRIYKDFLFKNILAFLSITEVFVGRLPDLGKEGLAYYSLKAQADIKDGKALLDYAVMDGSSMDIAINGEFDFLDQTIDAEGVVGTLKTVRRVVDLIPIIGKRLSNTFTTVPFKATGKWEDPQVETTKMSSIAPDLLGILTDLNKKAQSTDDPTAVSKD